MVGVTTQWMTDNRSSNILRKVQLQMQPSDKWQFRQILGLTRNMADNLYDYESYKMYAKTLTSLIKNSRISH